MKIDQSYQTKSRSASNNAEQSGTLQRKIPSLDELHLLADSSSQIIQLKTLNNQIIKKEYPVQLKKTKTSDQKGLPKQLDTGVEQQSGLDMGDVKVNYNSSKPSEIGAAAYAQGSDIHLGPEQKKHLPHEAWHVVQQKKGIVKSTGTINGTSVNEEKKLESEADQMGIKAQGLGNNAASILQKVSLNIKDRGIIQKNDSETKVELALEITPEVAPNLALIEKLAEYRGLVDMAKNAHNMLNDGEIWDSVSAGTDIMQAVTSTSEVGGAVTADVANVTKGVKGADKIAGDIAATIDISIVIHFQHISSLSTLYKGFKGKNPMAIAEGSKEFVAAEQSGLATANNILKAVGGVVRLAIAAAIPGLGIIVVSAADLMINLSNAMDARKTQAN